MIDTQLAISDKNILEKINSLSNEEKRFLYDTFHAKTLSLGNLQADEGYNNLRKIIFKEIPPTPEEILDPAYGWLPTPIATSLRDWVKEDFISIVNNSSNLSIVCEYGATRTGKSYLALLLIFYTIVYFHHLRDPNAFYGMAPTTSLVVFILSFNIKKAIEVYLSPLYNLLHMSDRFSRVLRQQKVEIEQPAYGMDKIVYSKAAPVGHITLQSGLQIVCGNSDALGIIGSNIINAFISEILYFIEYAGTSEEEIYRLYTDITERMQGTVGKNAFLSYTYLDSSANQSDSMIEKHILEDLRYKKSVYFRWRKRWDVTELQDRMFPKWKASGNTFKVCTGDGSYPPKILSEGEDLKVPNHLIIEVPIDVLESFERNLLKSIKDIAGHPTVSQSKFIQKVYLIDKIFDNTLLNIEHGIIADAKEDPEDFIFNKVKDKFFIYGDNKNLLISRAPEETRWIGVDLAYSSKGDAAGIAMMHKEYSKDTLQEYYIFDFAFAILPGENGINLDAIKFFICDLITKGNIKICNVSVDSFQSENLIQYLTRYDIPCNKQSVDKTIEAYNFLYGLMLSEKIKSGKNIYIKNNLDSLYKVKGKSRTEDTSLGKEKINHSIGRTNNIYNGSWKKSTCGTHAKDVSDAMAQCLYSCFNTDYHAHTSYEKENIKYSFLNMNNGNMDEQDIEAQEYLNNEKDRFCKKLNDIYKNFEGYKNYKVN